MHEIIVILLIIMSSIIHVNGIQYAGCDTWTYDTYSVNIIRLTISSSELSRYYDKTRNITISDYVMINDLVRKTCMADCVRVSDRTYTDCYTKNVGVVCNHDKCFRADNLYVYEFSNLNRLRKRPGCEAVRRYTECNKLLLDRKYESHYDDCMNCSKKCVANQNI